MTQVSLRNTAHPSTEGIVLFTKLSYLLKRGFLGWRDINLGVEARRALLCR